MSQYVVSFQAGGSTTVTTLTGNVGGAVPPTAGNINVIGAGGVLVTGNPGTSTLTITVAGMGLMWSVITADQTAAVNHGYFCNKAERSIYFYQQHLQLAILLQLPMKILI